MATMSTSNNNLEEDDSLPVESEDDFKYESVSVEDEWSLTEGEEDLEATVKAIRERAEATLRRQTAATHRSEAVDDFLRNFLFHMGMTETLDCFQAEWTEMLERGLLDQDTVGSVPDVYIENKRLESELKHALLEGSEYSRAASAAAQTLARLQKARDFHRLQHKRVVQEKNRLIEDMRKLKMQCNSREPAIKRMNEKYQALLKQTMQETIEVDKTLGQAKRQSDEHQDHFFCGDAGGESSVKGNTHPVIQPRPPTSPNVPRNQSRVAFSESRGLSK